MDTPDVGSVQQHGTPPFPALHAALSPTEEIEQPGKDHAPEEQAKKNQARGLVSLER